MEPPIQNPLKTFPFTIPNTSPIMPPNANPRKIYKPNFCSSFLFILFLFLFKTHFSNPMICPPKIKLPRHWGSFYYPIGQALTEDGSHESQGREDEDQDKHNS
jgi:hypothetical protein